MLVKRGRISLSGAIKTLSSFDLEYFIIRVSSAKECNPRPLTMPLSIPIACP